MTRFFGAGMCLLSLLAGISIADAVRKETPISLESGTIISAEDTKKSVRCMVN